MGCGRYWLHIMYVLNATSQHPCKSLHLHTCYVSSSWAGPQEAPRAFATSGRGEVGSLLPSGQLGPFLAKGRLCLRNPICTILILIPKTLLVLGAQGHVGTQQPCMTKQHRAQEAAWAQPPLRLKLEVPLVCLRAPTPVQ